MISLIALSALAGYTWNYQPIPGPLDNPLKGWIPYANEGNGIFQPSGGVYYNVYWKDLEPQEGVYKFAEWEQSAWSLPAAAGKHIFFRVIMDYPSQPQAIPQWLVDQGVTMTPYSDYGGGKSPDYTNPKLQAAVLKLIQALGQRYNNNPRIGFIELGMLGFWGEWHTYPHIDWFAKPDFQRKVIDGMLAAFPKKQLQARNPADESGTYPQLGYHDDMIPDDTLGPEDWQFFSAINKAGRQDNWKTHPMGGEMVPGAGVQYSTTDYPKLKSAVEQVHFSWIGPYCPAHVNSTDATFTSNCQEIVRKMGYQFHLAKATADVTTTGLSLTLEGENQGVAPFYEPWALKVALMDASGNVVQQVPTTIDIRSWKPGAFSATTKARWVARSGRYRLAIGVIDPWLNKPAVKFASTVGQSGGWQVLGEINVRTGIQKTSND